MTKKIEQPVVSANEQGVNADAQAGIVAHNDIPAATNDLTDAPHLPTEPAAVEDTLPTAIASADTETGSHNDALVSQANDPVPDLEPTADAFTAVEDAVVSEAEAYADMDDGVWQCQNGFCTSKEPDHAFTGPRQSVVQSSRVPLLCPVCGSAAVLYIGERVKKEVA